MKKSYILLLLSFLFIGFKGYAQDPNFHIYLCIGQSNMEGPAKIEPQDTTVNRRFQVFSVLDCPELGRSKGQWYTAKPPNGLSAVSDRLHFTSEGIRKFGKRYAARMLSLMGYKAPVED